MGEGWERGERGEGGGGVVGPSLCKHPHYPRTNTFSPYFALYIQRGGPGRRPPAAVPHPPRSPFPQRSPPQWSALSWLVCELAARCTSHPPTRILQYFCMNSSVIWRREREMTLLKVRTIRKRLVRNFILWTVLLGLKFEQLKIYTAYLQV